MYHVYAKSFPKGIQECFAGSRSQCNTWVRRKAMAGKMTHWYVVSKLDYAEAKKRYGVN